MAKRYGRKQRRAHRERIAYLENRLRHESTADLYLCDESDVDFENFLRVLRFRETEYGDTSIFVEREAEVVVIADKGLHDMIMDGVHFAFRGHRYAVTSCAVDTFENETVLELTMRGVQ